MPEHNVKPTRRMRAGVQGYNEKIGHYGQTLICLSLSLCIFIKIYEDL